MLFGVKLMSGLRHLRNAWRRSTWKYCPAVEGCTTCMLSRGAKLEIALNAGAGVLRSLPFVPVWQQQNQSGEQVPLVLTSHNELINDDLGPIGEVAELRLPHYQRFGVVARITVLKPQHGRFGQLRVVYVNARLARAPGGTRGTYSFSSSISISTECR